ncbi:MAG: o-succinylbenzoate synthase [Actinomycetota bacterium]|jgi:O-succinylbenzoate synthase|nr:o-succinylbenzoate synthase [Actinomycetota bacterium]
MRVEAVELRTIRLPLVAPFRTGGGSLTERPLVTVRVLTTEGEGWGECAALPEPTYTAEHVTGARAVLRDHLVPRLVGVDLDGPESVAECLRAVVGHPMATAALELAVLDAHLGAVGASLARALGGTATTVPSGVAVGLFDDVSRLVDTVAAFVEQGYRRVKLKVEPGWDTKPVAAVRERWPDLALQVDANGAYAGGDAGALDGLDHLGLLLIEQPLATDDLLGHAALARVLRTPICLDESISSDATLAVALALGSCSVVNLKAGRVGGYLAARRLAEQCQSAGVAVWCGGMIESGIGRAANLALASHPAFTLAGDLSASRRFFARDVVTEPAVLNTDGTIDVPAGPGLGVTIDAASLAAVTESVELVAAGD